MAAPAMVGWVGTHLLAALGGGESGQTYWSLSARMGVGHIGQGAACSDCPTGATCPGGNRVWPNPGWCVVCARFVVGAMRGRQLLT